MAIVHFTRADVALLRRTADRVQQMDERSALKRSEAESLRGLAALIAAEVYATKRPERAPVPAVDPSWSTPDALTPCHATHSPRSTEIL